jgi:hypothetical protein
MIENYLKDHMYFLTYKSISNFHVLVIILEFSIKNEALKSEISSFDPCPCKENVKHGRDASDFGVKT